MINLQTTRWPGAKPVTPGPSSVTHPEISWPRTHGVGNATSPFITCRSVWQTPHAHTRMRISPPRGFGRGISSRERESPTARSRAAFTRDHLHRVDTGKTPSYNAPTSIGCSTSYRAPKELPDAYYSVVAADIP